MADIISALHSGRLYFDGATGSYLSYLGYLDGILPEELNRVNPDAVVSAHREYLLSGADIIKSNTFGINPLKYDDYEERIVEALLLARRAIEGLDNRFVALDIGPLGKLIEPLGDLPFERAVELFSKIVKAGEKYCDLILIETINDCAEAKCAVLAAREVSEKPVFVSCVYDEGGRLMSGANPEAMIAMLEGLGVSAVGMNCSFGPEGMLPLAKVFAKRASLPVIVNPNAGLPRVIDGKTVYDLTPTEFARIMSEIAEYSGILGGCCGTTPEYIRELVLATRDIPYTYPERKDIVAVSSYTHAHDIGCGITLVGERINPTGKPRLKAALREGKIDYILTEAVSQSERGAHILDVNVGLADIDEGEMLRLCVKEIQAVTDTPLQLDTSSPMALESAMRIYVGKPLINSVSGKRESMDAVFPLVKKYGGVLIALTLDEGGIPDTAEGRVAIAEKIILEAKAYGIDKRDIIVDPLVMAISADKNSATVTLRAVKMLKDRGIKTSLGVSNISFGLPDRDRISAAFFARAIYEGLDMAIMNPYSEEMMSVYYATRALMGEDEGCRDYIAKYSGNAPARVEKNDNITLSYAILHGMRDMSRRLSCDYAKDRTPKAIIDEEIIPALNEIGKSFEAGRAYLPELLSVAEAASAAFDELRSLMPKSERQGAGKIILATVEGDIHDIGKNIVKVMLESYGYTCIDLGRSVPPLRIVEEAIKEGATLVGLSALMTTTVGAMERTISLLRNEAPSVRIMVGGAVLSEEYAHKIGADYYGADAMGAVRIAEEHFKVN